MTSPRNYAQVLAPGTLKRPEHGSLDLGTRAFKACPGRIQDEASTAPRKTRPRQHRGLGRYVLLTGTGVAITVTGGLSCLVVGIDGVRRRTRRLERS